MFSAIGIDFVLKGAKEEDILLVQHILDGYKGKWYFDSTIGNEDGGKVIPSETLELQDGAWVGVDLSENGIIKIKSDSNIGIIFYDEPDRQILLEQLVLMVSGPRIQDMDWADIIPILKKGCKFSWVECRDEDIKDSGIQLTRAVMKKSEEIESEFFIQITSNSLISPSDLLNAYDEMEEFKKISIVPQILFAENDNDLNLIAMFFPLKLKTQ